MKPLNSSIATLHCRINHRILRVSLLIILPAILAASFIASSSARRGETSSGETPSNDAGYKVTAVSVWTPAKTVADGSGLMGFGGRVASLYAPLVPQGGPESINTYKSDCTTLEAHFTLGDTVCAKVTNFSGRSRAIYWVSPDDAVVQQDSITSGNPQSSFTVNQAGNWRAYLVGFDNEARDVFSFSVSDPNNAAVDLSVLKGAGGSNFISGGVVTYRIIATNNGPDTATTVQLTEGTPNDTTLVGTPAQDSGPTFICTPGSPTVCTIDTFAAGASASFTFFYQINVGTPVGTAISNTVTLTSDPTKATELHPADNTWIDLHVVSGTGGAAGCSVACPEDVTTAANTTQNNQSGAIVHFTPPTGTTECGVITVDHCNDCFFPVGTTTVTGSATTGESCSFNVIVNPPNPGAPTIACPADQTAAADSNCSATLTIGNPTVTGDNVTFSGVRSDGQPMYNCDCFPNPADACDIHGACTRKADAPFPAGVTTITWTAYSHDLAGPYPDAATEEAHRTGTVSCTQTITVNDVTPPVITAQDSTVSADANCQAAVPDYSNQVTDNCACAASDTSQNCVGQHRITTTQDPAAGTIVGLGPHTIHLTANDGSSNNDGAGNTTQKDVTFTVKDTTAPMINCPANITTNTDPGLCSAVVNPGTATATDYCDSNPTVVGTRSDNQPLNAPYPKGTTTITWTATDASGNQSSCTQTVTVVDNEPPTITFNGNIPSMWPPNHAYHTFTAADFISSVSDNCDTLSVSDGYITKATSDEPENSPGSGYTLNDIVISGDCKSVQLRAERINNGNGRVYTIYFKLKDSSGNSSTGTAKVYSPKNQGETPGDDGPHYTVTSSCP